MYLQKEGMRWCVIASDLYKLCVLSGFVQYSRNGRTVI